MSNTIYKLDFNELAAGTIVDDEYAHLGLTISATRAGETDDDKAMIFDTAHPTGGDDDLATDNLHKALIITEDDDAGDPDDNARGGEIVFDFGCPTYVDCITVLDFDAGGTIELFDADGNLIDTISASTPDNGQEIVNIGVNCVAKMVVTLNGSGAVDNLHFSNDLTNDPDPNAGPVDGEDFGEEMLLGYDDANAPTDQGGDRITNKDDTIFGNGGDDTIDGAKGDDTIFGDGNSTGAGGTGELLVNGKMEAGLAPGTFNFNTQLEGWTSNAPNGVIEVWGDGFEGEASQDGGNFVELDRDTEVDCIWQDVKTVDGASYTLKIDLMQRIEGSDDVVEIYFGGQLIDTVTPGDEWQTYTYTVTGSGDDRLTFSEVGSDNNTFGPLMDNASLVGPIPGPITPGDDIIEGSEGDDVTFGDDGTGFGTLSVAELIGDQDGAGGDDTFIGGEGADQSWGEGGDDTVIITSAADGAGDTVVGGNGPDDTADNDVLDLRGAGPVVIDATDDATDAGAKSGTVTFQDGSVLTFFQVETILTDPPGEPGPVDGEETGEEMLPGYDDSNAPTDQGGDQIDGDDGDDDTIFGNGGDDTIDSGEGDDTVDGGFGDDDIVITETGSGIDNDVIAGGEDPDGEDFDLLDLSDIDDDLTVELTAPETGTITDGDDTTTFEEIEELTLGDGDDTVTGPGGPDTITGGNGDNLIDVGDDDPTLLDRGFPSYGPFPAIPADTDPDNDRDFVQTGTGDDTISTGDDQDTILAGDGDNVIDAGIDDDTVTTGDGDDLITTGEGNDTVVSGAGDDTIYGGLGPVIDDALDLDDEDDIFGPDPDPDNGRDSIDAGAGDDLVLGQDDDDTIFGGDGDDTLDGGIDDDLVLGEADQDTFLLGSRTEAIGDTIDGGTTGVDIDTLDLRGLGRFVIEGDTVDADGDSTSGTVNFIDADGNSEGTLEFFEIENLIPCFTPGTLIATPRGEVKVEELTAGDRVITRDDGIQEIQWIGMKDIAAGDLRADPKLKPVMIRKGALGNGLPERDMMVSPNHRMLIANENTQMLFDEREVLVAAKHLVGQPGVYTVDTAATAYIHLMFERHQVILGDGAWTESFQPGDQTVGGFDEDQREELFKLFPSLAKQAGREAYGAARQSLKAFEAKTLRETMGLK